MVNPANSADFAGAFSPVQFSVFAQEVQQLYQEPQKRRATIRKMRQVLREVGAFCPLTSDLTPLAISAWRAAYPGRAPHTWFSLLATLRAACSWMAYRRYAPNPFGFWRLSRWIPSDELGEVEPFRAHRSCEDIGRILHRADLEASGGDWHAIRLRRFVYCLAFTGAGLMEILGARWIDVDLPSRLIHIRSHPGRRLKTGARAARIPLAEPLLDVLSTDHGTREGDWIIPASKSEGYWHGGTTGYRPTDRVRQLGERAGVAGVTPLTFRHSFGTLSEDWGIGELMLQRILRHSRPQTQRHYRHHDAELLARAAAKVHFTVPSDPT
jgi:integrase